ncbi:SIT4 phosphatase-associated protein family [Lasallia pustulata]|uniref:SIT4 phosphatase-associated protein family n=1 Tax=Lasallia pustulata TaxID=136370 RepID=A0A1W5D7I7_9LECA|nr:SIT4 phosphatase-associated protein family [Lasallia pustulata]
MFWRFGGYANISTLDTILDKPDVTLEELLDESDLIQELKQHNTKLIEYLRDENVLRRLLEYVIAPIPPALDDEVDEEVEEATFIERALSPVRKSREQKEKSRRLEEREEREKAEKTRSKYAYIAAEVLSSETWSILEALMENQQHLRVFWNFLKREPPLDMTTAGYFTKVNEALMDKKTEETLEFVKSLDGVVPAMLQHVDCSMVMDLLLKIISMEKSEGGQGIVDWLQSQNLIPLLLAYLSGDHPPATQTSAGDFIKAIITISANASQNEQSCIGPNNLTRQLVSEACIESLVQDMLRGGNPLTVGVGIIIEVIRKNNSDYDPDVGAADSAPSSNDPIYLGTLLRLFARHVPDFTELILSPTHTVASGDSTMTIKRKELHVAFKGKIEPLGFDRFKTCELMAELLHCSNMGLLNERGSEAFVKRRDEERERLRAEGMLSAHREPRSETTEFSEDSTGAQNGTSSPLPLGPGSPEEIRKLEIANSADDDGFEDVGASADLGDMNDHFDGKAPFVIHSEPSQPIDRTAQTRPRLDLDEDFIDEPLTSPRLEALDEKEAEVPEPAETLDIAQPEPASPTSGLTSGVRDLEIDSDTAMTHGETSDLDGNHDFAREANPAAASEPGRHAPNGDAPPLPHRDRPLESLDASSPGDMSPHPDDKPAPLFAGRSEPVSHGDHAEETIEQSHEYGAGSGDSREIIDTTVGEEGDSSRSVLMSGNDQSFAPHVEADIDGQPIVGDFLKMMFVEHKVVPTILDFFFRFPWNNFLHNVVYDVVQQVFNGPMDRGYNRSLAIDLFETGRITERIVDGQERSDEAQAKNNMRLGYMGHLTLIAEEVVKFSERHAPELLSPAVLDRVTSKQWSDYVENTLSETRERDNAILGGVRPDMSVGPRQAVLNAVNAAHGFGSSGSSALANAGLNGGGSAGLDSMDLANGGSVSSGTFGLNSGSLASSGFGSSSDEEDEEMEEMEEGDGAAGAGGADQVGDLSFEDVDMSDR